MRRKEIQILLIERDRVLEAMHKLEKDRSAGNIPKLDYQILHERYESKLQEIEQKLGVGERKPKPSRLAGLRFWRKKSEK